MKKRINVIVIAIFTMLTACTNDYEFSVFEGKTNQIYINGKLLSEIVSDSDTLKKDSRHYIQLNDGTNSFRFIMNDGSIVDTTLQVLGEAYIGVNLESKTLIGFERYKK